MEEKSLQELIRSYITAPIEIEILPISKVSGYVEELFILEYALNALHAKEIVAEHLNPYLGALRDEIYVMVEKAYVDKMYRDTYYHFYSSKLTPHYRDCIRLSFFRKEIGPENFRPIDQYQQEQINDFVKQAYLGFLIIRPTFPKIIGRNAISPAARKIGPTACCLTKIAASVSSIKQIIHAFPHASQDNQTMTCSETTLWSILEYFGNKYPEYKPLKLSTINEVLHKFSFKRLIPSEGLTAEQISYAVREFGFGSMIYSRLKLRRLKVGLNAVISTYIESGIPVIGVLKSNKIGHALNIIGREVENPKVVSTARPHDTLANGIKLIDFHKVDRKYVFIDDNRPPYNLATLDRPCADAKEEIWKECTITNIIVPLYQKIYLDAVRAEKNFRNAFENKDIGLQGEGTRVVKMFLASTRTYKQYISLNKELDFLTKEFILAMPMPKFIWLAEISSSEHFELGLVDNLYIQDATEPCEDYTIFSNQSLIACYTNGTFFAKKIGKFEGVRSFANPFAMFRENLVNHD